MEVKLIKTEVNYLLKDEQFNVIISTTSLKKEGLALSLKNCQAIESGYDLDELAKEYVKISSLEFDAFKSGFKQALEILGDKKFSEDDVNLAFVLGKNKDESRINKLINSKLQQTEWDVIVEVEKVKDETKIIGSVKGVKGSGDKITTYKSIPKLDADGCLILKRKI